MTRKSFSNITFLDQETNNCSLNTQCEKLTLIAEDKAFSNLNDREETIQFVFKSEKRNTVTSY